MKSRKKSFGILMLVVLMFTVLAGCTTSSKETESSDPQTVTTAEETKVAESASEKVDVYVFLAASLKNTMDKVKTDYEEKHPNVNLIYNSDSSGTLQTQIQEGARCDVFFSAATKQMDALKDGGYVLDGSISNLLMNKIVLIKPAGEETLVTGFDNITDASNLALAGEDVPVGQYARKLFTNMGILDQVMKMEINEGPNVTAVLTAVAEGSNEVGVVYATDAASMADQVEIIAEADNEMVTPAVYPVGLIEDKEATEIQSQAAAEFKDYLTNDEDVKNLFTKAGFAQYQEAGTGQAMADLTGHTLSVYCGAGMTKPFQKIADTFKEQTGCEMEITFANAGQIQTQINTAKEGDLFLAGSADELKPVTDVITDSKDLVKHIPVLVVKSGNPFQITKLTDLVNPDIRLVLGDVKSTPIGKISDKAFTDAGILDKVNVVARTTTAPAIFNALIVDECDAIIVWKENVTDSAVEIVDTEEMKKYIKTVPAASLSYCDDQEALSEFLTFLNSQTAQDIWTDFGYEVIK